MNFLETLVLVFNIKFVQ